MCLTKQKEVSTMKSRIVFIAILSAMICATIMSGCNKTEVTSNGTEPAKTTSAVITTVAPTTQATETTVAPTTESETIVAQTEAETELQDTEPQTEAPKVEIEKPETNKPSSNTNNNDNSTTTQKPAQDTDNDKPSEKPVEKPAEKPSQTITDDAKLTHEQFCNSTNMNRVASALIDRYVAKGMTYDSTITTNNSGWMYAYQGQVDGQAVRSYNEHLDRIIVGMDEQLEAFMDMYGAKYTDLSFNCYEELQADGEYDIYFCFK